MSGAGRLLVWWLHPWTRTGAPLGSRAGRILLLWSALALTVLPAMMLRYGIDGWLWPLTIAVVICAPAGAVATDQQAELSKRRLRTATRLLILLAGLCLGVFVGYSLMFVMPLLAADETALLMKDFRRSMTILAGVAVVIAVAGSLLWYRTEAFRLQAAVDRARFTTLKQQMQPHFLFNSLNSLKELIAQDPALAQEATQRIADLYRSLIEVSRHVTTPLEHELSIALNYLEIERVRYGDRLRISVESDPGLGALHVPTLMLQTLAENAVKHGICKARNGGEVRIRARRRGDDWLELTVSNTGAPYAPSHSDASSGTATGLANTRARLDLMYGAASQLTVSSDPVSGTSVTFAVSGADHFEARDDEVER